LLCCDLSGGGEGEETLQETQAQGKRDPRPGGGGTQRGGQGQEEGEEAQATRQGDRREEEEEEREEEEAEQRGEGHVTSGRGAGRHVIITITWTGQRGVLTVVKGDRGRNRLIMNECPARFPSWNCHIRSHAYALSYLGAVPYTNY
jgi:hypothetical protein